MKYHAAITKKGSIVPNMKTSSKILLNEKRLKNLYRIFPFTYIRNNKSRKPITFSKYIIYLKHT